MTLVRVFVTQEVTALPLKRNHVPRFTIGGGVQENDEGCIGCGD
jgi:hypothetical protein